MIIKCETLVNENNRKQKMAKCKEVLLIKSRRDLRV